MITRLRYPKGYQFFDANGAPLALGNLYYYVAGTTTPQNTYSDAAGTVANTNPIIFDASGRLDVDVYLGSTSNYKEVLTTASATVSPWPDDNIPLAAQADWNATSGPNQILNKPVLAAVATSGSYTDLSNTPPTNVPFTGDSGFGGTSGLVPAPAAGDALANMFLSAAGDWVTPPGSPVSINLSTSAAAASGSVLTFAAVPASITAGMLVTDTTTSMVIPAGTTVVSTTSTTVTLSEAVIGAGVASGDSVNFYGPSSLVTNLSVTEAASTVSIASSSGTGVTIPAATLTAAGVLDSARAAKIDGLATVATSGSYSDLVNKPNVFGAASSTAAGSVGLVPAPTAGQQAYVLNGAGQWVAQSGGSGGSQVNSDWNATSGVAQILNKPTLGTAAAQNIPATGNASASQVVYGTDTRLSDSRSPQAHASTHASGGSDPVSIAASQVSGIPASLASQNLDNVARVGIGTTDTTNPLSVMAASVLFANTGDMRASISKGAASNSAAFNFQDNYSTRVQFGLLGNDNFTISTSPDGSTFNSALVATAAGAVSFPNTPGFTGDSGSGGSVGLVPAPAAGNAAAGAFLKADGTWSVPAGSTSPMTGATTSFAGATGLVPAPAAGQQGNFLRGDGTWDQMTASQVTGFATVAVSGSYTDLSNQPAIPAAQVNSDWNAASGLAQVLNKPALATVATSGSYNDLSNKPAIPNAQVNSDWNATSGLAQILNKPSLAAVATTGAYSSLSGTPAIPGAMTGATSGVAGTGGTVPAPSAGQQAYVLSGAGTWVTQTGGVTNYGTNYGFGSGVLNSSMTGGYNLAQGYQSGAALTSGSNNFLSGYRAGNALTSGSNGIFIGYQAGLAQQSFAPSYSDPAGAQTNIFIGEGAGAATQVSWGNIGIGRGTLASLTNNPSTSGSPNFLQNNFNGAIGDMSGNALTSGSENYFYGNNTGLHTTTGLQNTAMGTEPFKANVGGCFNAVYGGSALKGSISGSYLAAFGNAAGGGDGDPSTTTSSNFNSFFGAGTGNYDVQTPATAASASGTNTITVSSVSGISVGMLAADTTQYGSTTSPVYTIPNNTVVTAINPGTKIVTLSQNIVSPGVSSGDIISFFGNPVSVATSAATASGSTLTFAEVPNTVVGPYNMGGAYGYGATLTNTPGMLVYDLTAPSAIPAGTTVASVTGTTVTLSAAVAATVNSGDTIIFVKSQSSFMTVIGANAQGNRDNTIFLGRSSDSVVIAPPAGGTNSLAGLTIGSGSIARAAINMAQNVPSGQNPPINGDLWRDYNDNLWMQLSGTAQQLNLAWTNSNSDLFIGKNVGSASLTGSNNILVGSSIATGITTGSNNTIVGASAGSGTSLTTFSNNTLFGYQAGQNIASSANTIIGGSAGTAGITGGGNNIVGFDSGVALTSGTSNVIEGPGSGQAMVSAFGNTIVGASVANSLTGSTNTIVGYHSGGSNLTSGAGNTIIGANISPAANISNTFIAGAGGAALITATASALTLAPLTSAGLVATSASGVISVPSAAAATTPANFSATTKIAVTIGSTTYYIPADTSAW